GRRVVGLGRVPISGGRRVVVAGFRGGFVRCLIRRVPISGRRVKQQGAGDLGRKLGVVDVVRGSGLHRPGQAGANIPDESTVGADRISDRPGAHTNRGLLVGGENNGAEFGYTDLDEGPLQRTTLTRVIQQRQQLAVVLDEFPVDVAPLVAHHIKPETHTIHGAIGDGVADRLNQPVIRQTSLNKQTLVVLTEIRDRAEGNRPNQRVPTVVELHHRGAFTNALLESALTDLRVKNAFPRVDPGRDAENCGVTLECEAVAFGLAFVGAHHLERRRTGQIAHSGGRHADSNSKRSSSFSFLSSRTRVQPRSVRSTSSAGDRNCTRTGAGAASAVVPGGCNCTLNSPEWVPDRADKSSDSRYSTAASGS